MIAAHEDGRPLAIEDRLLAAGAQAGAGDEPAGPIREHVGPYRLLRLLGRGGMGEVHLAERADGEYRGQVAIKLLAGGAGHFSGERERRLRRERQILASLRHPGIATLYDGGIAADGQPYLVMEHVDGQPINQYGDENRLTLRERLELFATVCDAVQYAHARLVVHRDLKPSNLLVTADGASKLLDFGIAKLLDGAENADTDPHAAGEPTRAEVRVFTPSRAAPEQIHGEPVSTATDVYALGVLLFELLSGRLPFRSDLRGEHQGLGVPRELRGDLEAILTRAMARRPEERYAAAGFLAEDVRRHLAGEPVQARRQTRAYRGRKFVKRHAGSVLFVALAGLSLAAMAWFAAAQARRASRERDLAVAERQRGKAALDSLVDLLSLADPIGGGGAVGDQLSVAGFLSRAERRASDLDESEVAARLLLALGRIQRERTDFRAAERLLGEARRRRPGDEGVLTEIELELGRTLRELGQRERARRLLKGVHERRRSRSGGRHPGVFAATLELLLTEPDAAAMPKLKRLLAEERAALPAGTLLEADTLNALGAAHFRSGDSASARRYLEESAAILGRLGSAAHPFKLKVLGNLAATLDDPRHQERVYRGRIATAAALYGSESTVLASGWNSLGGALARQGRHGEAEAAFRRGHGIFAARLGDGHAETANALRNVGRAQQLQGRYPEALSALRGALAVFVELGTPRARFGAEYQTARVAWLVERSPQALASLRASTRTLAGLAAGPHDTYPADAMVALGVTLLEAGQRSEAAEVLQEALDRHLASGRRGPKEMEARCALRLAQTAGATVPSAGAKPDPRELRACAEALPGWGLADPELVAGFAPWR